MADVYLAEDRQLGRKVAIKLLHQRFAEDAEFVERFRREASAAAGLQHPNVVSVYDRGQVGDTYYIAMEYLEGRSLKQIVIDEAPLAPGRAIELVTQVLKAARFAHKRGIIHRDLKPHNVIVDDEDRAKVTDFGIARAGASDMTETGSILGTAQYLSPEQAQGLAVSAQSDLYAIGVILYELVTGQVPFGGDTAVAVALKHVAQSPVRPSEINPAVPPELDDVILWALEKDPRRRPADADQFLAALDEVRARLGADGGPSTAAFAAVAAADVPVAPPVLPVGTGEVEAVPADEPEEHERRGWRWLLVLLLVLLLAGGGVAAYLLTRGKQVLVPRVVGESLTIASARLQNQGFVPNVIRRTSDLPRDEVIGQSPLAGEKRDEGS